MIPCKQCLVLAACKHKKEVECETLHNWILDEGNRLNMNVYDLFDCTGLMYINRRGSHLIQFSGKFKK